MLMATAKRMWLASVIQGLPYHYLQDQASPQKHYGLVPMALMLAGLITIPTFEL